MSESRIKQAIRFYEQCGHFGPFSIKGGDGEGDGDGATGSGDGAGTGKETDDLAGLKTALANEREARKAADKTAKDLQKRLTDIENSGKSESEKLAARLEALEKDNQAKGKAIQERDARDAVKDAAKKAGAPDPDLIFRVLKSDLEYDDDGSVSNLKPLIDDLKQTTPHLFKAPASKVDGGSGNSGNAKEAGMNAWIRREAGVT